MVFLQIDLIKFGFLNKKSSNYKISYKNCPIIISPMSALNQSTLSEMTNFSIRLIQSRRIFDLIQQNIPQPTPHLTTKNIENFIKISSMDEDLATKASKIMYLLNKEGVEMSSDQFSKNLAQLTKDLELSTQQSLLYLYKQIKDVFSLKYQPPMQKFQKWDSTQTYTQQITLQRSSNIMQFHSKLQPYIDSMQVMTFQNHLDQINYCLSIVMLHVSEQQISQVFTTFMCQNVMRHVANFLGSLGTLTPENTMQFVNISDQILPYCVCIGYFYTGCRYQAIKDKLQANSVLLGSNTFSMLIYGLNIPESRVKKQILVCLALLSKYSNGFRQWILASVDNNLMPLLQAVGSAGQNQGIQYALTCIKHIVKCFQQKPQPIRTNETYLSVMSKIQSFIFYLLKTLNSISNQRQCLVLISELLRVLPVTSNQIQQLKLTTKVFQTQKQLLSTIAPLIPPTLRILQVAIVLKIQDLANFIVNDHGFGQFLVKNVGNRGSFFYYDCLHVVYLLSVGNMRVLERKGILHKLAESTLEDPNPVLASVFGEVVFNYVQQAVENDAMLETLYDKFQVFERVIPILFKRLHEKNALLDIFMASQKGQYTPDYACFDKSLLLNIFRMMYCLAVGVSRRHRKYAFSKRINYDIVKALAGILDSLFQSDKRGLIELLLKQKVKILNSKKFKLQSGIPLFKMVNIILDEMTYNMDNRPIELLKLINQQKKSFCTNLLKCEFFTVHELQVEGIPIYLSIGFTYNENTLRRIVPHKFELSSLKSYIRSFVCKFMQVKENQIRDFVIKNLQTNRVIENQVQYRTLVNKTVQGKLVQLDFEVSEIRLKTRREDLSASFVNDTGRSLRMTNSFVQRVDPRAIHGTTRYTQLQPHHQRTWSPISYTSSYNNRSHSPAFGTGTQRN